MGKSRGAKGGGSEQGGGGSNKRATLVICVIFWVVIALVVAILLAALFKAKEPQVAAQTIMLQELRMSGGYPHISALNLSLSLVVLLNNPNRATFHYSLSTASLFHAGSQLGFQPIPSGHLGPQQALDLNIDLSPQATSLLQGPYLSADLASGLLTLGTSVVIFGHLTVLGVFPHHSTSASNCTLVISLSKGTLEGYHCIDNISL